MLKSISCFLIFFTISQLFSQSPGLQDSNSDGESSWDYSMDIPWRNSRPIVEFSYGYNTPKQSKFQGEFARIGATEIKLGFSQVEPFRKVFLELDENFLIVSYSSKDVTDFDNSSTDKVYTDYLRFGCGSRSGYGYDLAPFSILPYYHTQWSFTRVKSERPESLSKEDNDILDRYEGSYRFGSAIEGGVKVLISNSVGLTVSYEAAVINPRIVFFPWIGGVIVQNVIVEIVGYFGKEIVYTGHWMGPLMWAILKNGAAYGVYLGMKERQFWPFNSETPLTHETFKLSLSVTF